MKSLATSSSVLPALVSTLALLVSHPVAAQGGPSVGRATPKAPAAPASELPKADAPRVYEGVAQCDLNESVSIRAVANRPGHYEVRHRNSRYQMQLEPTKTGAVKLRDARARVVWLQIPSTSMLLDDKIGQRVASNCLSAEQNSNNAEAQPRAGSALGIEGTAKN